MVIYLNTLLGIIDADFIIPSYDLLDYDSPVEVVSPQGAHYRLYDGVLHLGGDPVDYTLDDLLRLGQVVSFLPLQGRLLITVDYLG